MITKEMATKLHYGQNLYHTENRNADGSPQKWMVNGKCKTWKTRPNDFQVPLKYGLYTYDYLNQACADKLCLSEEEAIGDTEEREIKRGVMRILESEMKSVAKNLDNGQMDCFSGNVVRDKCVRENIFESNNQALFWFNDNSEWVRNTFELLNKKYHLPFI